MFCSQCGQQIVPEHARFCWSCGVALHGAVGAPGRHFAPNAPVWETCDVTRAYTLDAIVPSLKAYVNFVAETDGPSGRYSAARSPEFTINPSFCDPDFTPKKNDRDAQAALQALVEQLQRDGWDQIGDGPLWFNRKFRRKVV